jgi:sulfite reductase beta subunit-like hemoprotein
MTRHSFSEYSPAGNLAGMYRYDQYDQRFIDERVAQFRDQTRRFLAGELTEDEFRPLRLQNGLYIQRYAPPLRAVPSLLSSTLRTLAHRRVMRLGHALPTIQFNGRGSRCRTSGRAGAR